MICQTLASEDVLSCGIESSINISGDKCPLSGFSKTTFFFWLKIPFFDRLIYVAWSGGSMSSVSHGEPTLWMILCWSHSRRPSVMTFCVHGGGALQQAVYQTVILTVSTVQRSCGSSGLVMIQTYKGLYQQNWKVMEQLLYECDN